MSTYQKLPLGSNDGEAYLVHSTNPDTSICSTCSQYSRQRNLLPWIWCSLCTIVTVLAVVRSTLQQTPFLTSPPSSGNRAPKHATDFISAPKTPYVTREFYNYYDFNPADHRIEFNRTLASKPGFTLYAGVPTKEIDEAWEELLGGTWMAIDGEEVSSVQAAAPWPLDPFGEEGQVYMEVGVFHDLHCVVRGVSADEMKNLLRQALDPAYYNIHTDFTSELEPMWKQVHVYHCIDQLRQAIQCHSDLTPAPLFKVDGLEKDYYLGHSVAHTCRDFEAVKRWRDERNKKRKSWSW